MSYANDIYRNRRSGRKKLPNSLVAKYQHTAEKNNYEPKTQVP